MLNYSVKKLKGKSEQLDWNGYSEVCRKCQKSSHVHNVKVNIWAFCRKALAQYKRIEFLMGCATKKRLFSLAHLMSICFINKQSCQQGNVLAPLFFHLTWSSFLIKSIPQETKSIIIFLLSYWFFLFIRKFTRSTRYIFVGTWVWEATKEY